MNSKKDKSTEISFQIVEFQPQYTQKVIDLVWGSLKELHVISCDDTEPDEDLLKIPEVYKGKGRFWVALRDDKVIGSVALKDMGNSVAKLKRMFVLPKYHGTGVGQALFDHALAFAKKEGYTKVVLNTHPLMKRAHRFYEKNGFTKIGGTAQKYHYELKL